MQTGRLEEEKTKRESQSGGVGRRRWQRTGTVKESEELESVETEAERRTER